MRVDTFENRKFIRSHRGLTPSAKIVLLDLIDRQGENVSAFPSIPKICEDCSLSRASVCRAIGKIREVSKDPNSGIRMDVQKKKTKNSKQPVNHYAVAIHCPQSTPNDSWGDVHKISGLKGQTIRFTRIPMGEDCFEGVGT